MSSIIFQFVRLSLNKFTCLFFFCNLYILAGVSITYSSPDEGSIRKLFESLEGGAETINQIVGLVRSEEGAARFLRNKQKKLKEISNEVEGVGELNKNSVEVDEINKYSVEVDEINKYSVEVDEINKYLVELYGGGYSDAILKLEGDSKEVIDTKNMENIKKHIGDSLNKIFDEQFSGVMRGTKGKDYVWCDNVFFLAFNVLSKVIMDSKLSEKNKEIALTCAVDEMVNLLERDVCGTTIKGRFNNFATINPIGAVTKVIVSIAMSVMIAKTLK